MIIKTKEYLTMSEIAAPASLVCHKVILVGSGRVEKSVLTLNLTLKATLKLTLNIKLNIKH